MSQLNEHLDYAKNLWENGHQHDHIELELTKRGLQHEMVQEVIKHIKDLRYAKRRSRGMNLLTAGCVFLLLGFLCTLFVSYSDTTFHYTLYGFTMLGICLVMLGVADIMG
ncbi:MAG: hypothetical protein K1X81_10020 [Bacteroidia bacterium]|nr:hypothetical protein [Bacteroidia bacterium]